MPILQLAHVSLTLSAHTSYDGKLPSAGVAQWQSEGLIIPRPWVRFPPPAPSMPAGVFEERADRANPRADNPSNHSLALRLEQLQCLRLMSNSSDPIEA